MPLVRKPTGPSERAPDDLAALDSTNADERWAAARAATAVPADAARLQVALAKEADPRVREALFSSLARIGTTESTQVLLSLLRSNDAALRTGALDALGAMALSMKEFLPRLLDDPDVDVRILSCELARKLSGEDATGLLRDVLLREQDVNVCAAAIDVLAEVGGPDAAPVLEECTRRFRDSPFLVFAATTAIERLEAQSARPRA